MPIHIFLSNVQPTIIFNTNIPIRHDAKLSITFSIVPRLSLYRSNVPVATANVFSLS